MHSRGAHATVAVFFIESNSEENICRLRSAVRDEGIIGCLLKIGILEVNFREAVTCGRQIDQPPSWTDKRRDPVHQDKVAQMIRAELHLETVTRAAKGC